MASGLHFVLGTELRLYGIITCCHTNFKSSYGTSYRFLICVTIYVSSLIIVQCYVLPNVVTSISTSVQLHRILANGAEVASQLSFLRTSFGDDLLTDHHY